MKIGGLLTMTLLDYPGKVAATIFTSGCNLRCPFCQNADLVLMNNISSSDISEESVLSFLKKRQGLLDGVCITGGEPTLQSDIFEFIYKIKNLGYFVKLDTNGTNPSIIKRLNEGHLIDYIAMDYKSSKANYGIASGINNDITASIEESVKYIINSGLDYEFRTTLVKGIHTYEDMELIANELEGATSYFIQSYKDSDRIIAKLNGSCSFSSFSDKELETFLSIAQKKLPEAKLRGVE